MSIAYVCPYACVPWLGTFVAGLFMADQRPLTGGSTSTGGWSRTSRRGPVRLTNIQSGKATSSGRSAHPQPNG